MEAGCKPFLSLVAWGIQEDLQGSLSLASPPSVSRCLRPSPRPSLPATRTPLPPHTHSGVRGPDRCRHARHSPTHPLSHTQVCEALAAAGMRVVAVARRKERLEELQERVLGGGLGVAPADFLPVVCDITKDAEASVGEEVWTVGGGLDVAPADFLIVVCDITKDAEVSVGEEV